VDEANVDLTAERAVGPRLRGSNGLDDGALDELLQKTVLLACLTVSGAHAVSITVADSGGFRTSNFSSDDALAIDEAQYQCDDGPCLRSLRSARQVQLTVGAGDHRSVFDEVATEVGVTTVLSTPLIEGPGEAFGALNIYSQRDGAFAESDRRIATIIGEHAALLVQTALARAAADQLNEQLRFAVASREIIGEAKGIIMERQACTRDEAFDVLRRASQRENRKLREVAEDLVVRVEAREREVRAGG